MQKEDALKKTIAEQEESLTVQRSKKDGCKDCSLLREELKKEKVAAQSKFRQLEERADAADSRAAAAEKRADTADERAGAAERRIAEQTIELTNRLQGLGSSVQMAQKMQRRICLDDARKHVLQILGSKRKGANETWKVFVEHLSEQERQQVGLSTGQLKLLAVGKKTLNEVAHEVSCLELVADAVLQAPAKTADWCGLFLYAYGKKPQDVIFEEDEDS